MSIKKSYLLEKAGEFQETIYQLITTRKPAGLLFEHYVGCYSYVFDQFAEVQSKQSTERNKKISDWVHEEQLKETEEDFWVTADMGGLTDTGFGRIRHCSGKGNVFKYDF